MMSDSFWVLLSLLVLAVTYVMYDYPLVLLSLLLLLTTYIMFMLNGRGGGPRA